MKISELLWFPLPSRAVFHVFLMRRSLNKPKGTFLKTRVSNSACLTSLKILDSTITWSLQPKLPFPWPLHREPVAPCMWVTGPAMHLRSPALRTQYCNLPECFCHFSRYWSDWITPWVSGSLGYDDSSLMYLIKAPHHWVSKDFCRQSCHASSDASCFCSTVLDPHSIFGETIALFVASARCWSTGCIISSWVFSPQEGSEENMAWAPTLYILMPEHTVFCFLIWCSLISNPLSSLHGLIL